MKFAYHDLDKKMLAHEKSKLSWEETYKKTGQALTDEPRTKGQSTIDPRMIKYTIVEEHLDRYRHLLKNKTRRY